MVDKGVVDSLMAEQQQWQKTSQELDQVRSRAHSPPAQAAVRTLSAVCAGTIRTHDPWHVVLTRWIGEQARLQVYGLEQNMAQLNNEKAKLQQALEVREACAYPALFLCCPIAAFSSRGNERAMFTGALTAVAPLAY